MGKCGKEGRMSRIQKLTTAYSRIDVSVKAGAWFVFCNFLQKGIAMISLPIFTRMLSVAEYGQVTVYQSWYAILSIFVTLNLSGSVIHNGLVKFQDRQSEFVSATQGLASVVALLFLGLYLLFQDFWNQVFDLSTPLMLIMFAQFLFEPAYQMWLQKNRFEFRYVSAVFVTLLVCVASPALGIVLVQAAEKKALARILGYAIVQICVGAILYILQWRKGKRLFVREYWKFALVFNLPLVPHYLSQHILGQADRIMISRMVGDREAAIYGVAYTLGSALSLLINAINGSFIPALYQNMKRGNYASIRKNSSLISLLMAIVACLIMLVAPELIAILAGPKYAEAVRIVPPVAASVFFTYLYSLFINVEFYFEKTQYTMYVSVIGAVLNIALNYLLIPVMGYVAAGYTTLFCFVLFAFGHYVLGETLLRKNAVAEPVFDKKAMLLLAGTVLLFTIAMNILYTHPVLRVVFLIFGILAVAVKRKQVATIIKMIAKK